MRSGQCLTIGIWRAMCNASQFLDLYLGELKGNGVKSYCRVFPRAKYQSAKSAASRMLKKPSVLQAMKHKLDKVGGVNLC
jgi:hypothetical protein